MTATLPAPDSVRRRPGTSARRTGSPVTVRGLKISHPDRVIDPASGHTKLDLVRYYDDIAARLLPHLRGRPCSLVRGPDGLAGSLFFQKHMERRAIPGVTRLPAALWPAHEPLMAIDSAHGVVGAAQMNTIEFHTWNAKVERIDAPDRMVFDLDPGDGVGWPQMRDAARQVRDLLHDLALESWVKTSGSRGLHVVVPLAPRYGWDAVRDFSHAIVDRLASTRPDVFAGKSGAANRVGRIFADYLRNGLNATTATAYSVRARPGLGVSMPVHWGELDEIDGAAHWTVDNACDHLARRRDDPWAGYWRRKQNVANAMKRLGFEPGPPPAKPAKPAKREEAAMRRDAGRRR